jgi:hypothetical protein
MMKKFLVAALALGAMSSAALAEPVKLTDTQLGAVSAAGFYDNLNVTKQFAEADSFALAVNKVDTGSANAESEAVAANENQTQQTGFTNKNITKQAADADSAAKAINFGGGGANAASAAVAANSNLTIQQQ